MREWQSQAHVKHYCKYHVVFVPKYRKKSIYGTLRKDIGRILRMSYCQIWCLRNQSSGDLIVLFYLDAVFKLYVSDHFSQVIKSS